MEKKDSYFFKSDIYFGTSLYNKYPCVKYYWNPKDTDIPIQLKKIIDYLQSQYKNILSEIKINNTKGEATIITHFPLFWEISDKAIKKLIKSNNQQASDELKANFKKIIGTASAIPILDAAIKRDLPITIQKIGENYYKHFGYGKGSQFIQSTSSSKDPKFAKKFQSDKAITNEIAESLMIPVPKWKIVLTEEELIKAYKSFKEVDIVIKPYDLTRGIGVYVGIKDINDAIEKFRRIKELYKARDYEEQDQKILIQQRVYGKDYRILCINGKFEVATLRTPAYVIGDGKSTIEQLIKIENQNPARSEQNLFHTLKQIIIDQTMIEMLSDQNMTIETVPPKEQMVYVRKAASVSQGGFTEDVTDKVNQHTKTMCELISKQLNAFTLGIDIMCSDITLPLYNNNGWLIEVNTAPEMYLNLFPAKGRKRNNKGTTYLNALVPQNTPQKCYFTTLPSKNITSPNDVTVLVAQHCIKLPVCIIMHKSVYEMTQRNILTYITQVTNSSVNDIYNMIKTNKRYSSTLIITNDKKELLMQKFNPILSEI